MADPCPYLQGIQKGDQACLSKRSSGAVICENCPVKMFAPEEPRKEKKKMPKGICSKCGAQVGNRWLKKHEAECDGVAKGKPAKRPYKKRKNARVNPLDISPGDFDEHNFQGLFIVSGITINPEASLDDLKNARALIENAISAKLGL